jgi:hypothetical protein
MQTIRHSPFTAHKTNRDLSCKQWTYSRFPLFSARKTEQPAHRKVRKEICQCDSSILRQCNALSPSLLQSQRRPAMGYSFGCDDACIRRGKKNETLKTNMKCFRQRWRRAMCCCKYRLRNCHRCLCSPRVIGSGGRSRSFYVRDEGSRMIRCKVIRI